LFLPTFASRSKPARNTSLSAASFSTASRTPGAREALHAQHPHLTYDVTIKIEHLLRHADALQPSPARLPLPHQRCRITG
jgi:hypothetical protein